LLGRAFTGPTPLGRELSASKIDVKRIEEGDAMPKKYRVEMTLLVDATNVVVDTDEHTENEDDDTKAKGIGLDACSSGQAETLEWGKTQPPNAKRRAA
jgi:hypothetical protein